MHYVVRSIKVAGAADYQGRDAFVYPPEGWHVAAAATAESLPDGEWRVASARRRWSYCFQYGPLRARRSGQYRFTVRTEILDGGIALGVLAGDQRSWLQASIDRRMTTEGDLLSVSVSLNAGDRFSLMISNDHPAGDATSRFIVRELTGSAEIGVDLVWTGRRATGRSERNEAAVAGDTTGAVATGDASSAAGGGSSTSDVVRSLRAPAPPTQSAEPLLRRIAEIRRAKARRAEEMLDFSVSGWRPATTSPALSVEHRADDVLAVTDPRRWWYCLEYGPLVAPVRGIYRFDVEGQVLAGGARLGILSGDQSRWLPPVATVDHVATERPFSAAARLRKGQRFWLVLYNDHPEGEGVSRLLVGKVTPQIDVRDAMMVTGRAVDRLLRKRNAADLLIVPSDDAGYPLERWKATASNVTRTTGAAESALLVSSAPQKWSYCLEYGPLRAATRGTYHFTLTYGLEAGGIVMGVLGERKKKWLRSSAQDVVSGDRRVLTVSVFLSAGRSFWLLISNDHPDGEGVSRFEIQSLTSRFEASSWARVWLEAIRAFWSNLVAWFRAAPARMARGIAELGRSARGLRPMAGVRAWLPRSRVARAIETQRRRMARAIEPLRRRMVLSAPEYQLALAGNQSLEETVRTLAPLRELDRLFTLLQDRRPDALHLNGCGDFQLMAREHWFELRGYPEFQTFSMNIDGLFSSMACYAGVTERVLESPCHIYHIEHEVGSGWSPEGEALLRRRIAERGITWIDSRDVFVWSAYMHWLKRPMIFNTSEWGLAGSNLDERSVFRTPRATSHSH
jgi:hypothetical protein